MNCYLNSRFNTKFGALESLIVFTTTKTLNDRFTPSPTRRSFVVNNGYTSFYPNNHVAEKIAFENRGIMDIHRRISLYREGNLKLIEREVFENESSMNYNRLSTLGNFRRTVLEPRMFFDESTEHNEEYGPRVLSPGSHIMSPTDSIEFQNTRDFYELLLNKKLTELDYKFMNSLIVEARPVKRTWNGIVKGKSITTGDSYFNNSKGSEPIIYKPHSSNTNNKHASNYDKHSSSYKDKRSSNKNNKRPRQSLYKWKRAQPTKEELDDELDRYMSEAKVKETPVTLVKDDVDSFVMEYMQETEKSLNKNTDIF